MLVYPNTQLTQFCLGSCRLYPLFVTDVLCRCSNLRELHLHHVLLDKRAINALTRGFAEGTLQLTALWLEKDGESFTTYPTHVYNAARQWLMAPARSLTTLCLYLYYGHKYQPASVELQAAEGLVAAVAQRGAEGRPCERVELGRYPHAVALEVCQIVARHGVEGVVSCVTEDQ